MLRNENRNKRKRKPIGMLVEAVATMIGCLPTQALAFLVVFVYATHATHATQAIALNGNRALACTTNFITSLRLTNTGVYHHSPCGRDSDDKYLSTKVLKYYFGATYLYLSIKENW